MPRSLRTSVSGAGVIGVASGYSYGWPSGGTSESDVGMQLLFEEDGTTGYIYDEVEGVRFSRIGGPDAQFGVTASGSYAGLSPGIEFDYNDAEHYISDGYVADPYTGAEPGIGSFTAEVWFAPDATYAGDRNVVFVAHNAGNYGWFITLKDPTTNQLFFHFRAEDETTLQWTSTPTANLFDGKIHKLRVVLNRDSHVLKYSIDGNWQDATDATAIATADIPQSGVEFGYSGNYSACTYYEFRTSHNATNNSSHPSGTEDSPPIAPTSLTASAFTSTRIDLSWTRNSKAENGVKIYRSASNSPYSWSLIHTAKVKETTYSDTGLTAETPYWYKVVYFDEQGDSADSNIANDTTLEAGFAAWTAETQTVALWHMDESSGSVVDEVNSITLPYITGRGACVYGTEFGGDYENVDPGITYNGVYQQHLELSALSDLDIGASEDANYEWIATTSSSYTSGYNNHFASLVTNTTTSGVSFYQRFTTVWIWYLLINTDDATNVLVYWYDVPAVNDGIPRKYQLLLDHDGNATLKINGTSLGTKDISAIAGKAITNSGFRLGGQYNGGADSLDGTMLEFRASIGDSTVLTYDAPWIE